MRPNEPDPRDPHDHEFYEPDSEYFEDGAFIVINQCDHAPILNSWTDDTRDETYYETGPRCEVQKHIRLDVSTLEAKKPNDGWMTLAESDGNLFHECYQGDTAPIKQRLVEEIEHAIAASLTKEGSHCEVPIGERRRTIECDGVSINGGTHERIVTVVGSERPEAIESTYRVHYDNVTEDLQQ
jgi:hypothetical protein